MTRQDSRLRRPRHATPRPRPPYVALIGFVALVSMALTAAFGPTVALAALGWFS
jgi:hypothetical protein